MMAHMNAAAAAAAAAAMGIGSGEPTVPAATAATTIGNSAVPTLAAQSFYPASLHYSPHSLLSVGDDASKYRNLLELQPAGQSGYALQSPQSQYSDYQPQAESLVMYASTIKHTGQPQAVTKEKRSTGEFSEEMLDSENEEESRSVSINDDEEKMDKNRQFKMENGDLIGGIKMGKKICRVCGDKALGYNFNVVSCESCKAFFRRNALKPKVNFNCFFCVYCIPRTYPSFPGSVGARKEEPENGILKVSGKGSYAKNIRFLARSISKHCYPYFFYISFTFGYFCPQPGQNRSRCIFP